jgi:hypothetical protein
MKWNYGRSRGRSGPEFEGNDRFMNLWVYGELPAVTWLYIYTATIIMQHVPYKCTCTALLGMTGERIWEQSK